MVEVLTVLSDLEKRGQCMQIGTNHQSLQRDGFQVRPEPEHKEWIVVYRLQKLTLNLIIVAHDYKEVEAGERGIQGLKVTLCPQLHTEFTTSLYVRLSPNSKK